MVSTETFLIFLGDVLHLSSPHSLQLTLYLLSFNMPRLEEVEERACDEYRFLLKHDFE